MSVGAADHIAIFKIRVLAPDPVEIFKVMELRAGKRTAGRYEAKIGEQARGSLIHMGGICDALEGSNQREHIVERDRSSIDEEIFHDNERAKKMGLRFDSTMEVAE